MNSDLFTYYSRRAKEYERIYEKPERQEDLAKIREKIETIFSGHTVLEIACGTGYWTEMIAKTAASVLATDFSENVLAVAKSKSYGTCKITFQQANAYSLANIDGMFSAGFCGFWWSHIPKEKIQLFLQTFHARLPENALVVFLDNRYVEGSSTAISRRDEAGNTYQIRKLKDGSSHEVLKNFPSENELKANIGKFSQNFHLEELRYYWLLSYQLKKF